VMTCQRQVDVRVSISLGVSIFVTLIALIYLSLPAKPLWSERRVSVVDADRLIIRLVPALPKRNQSAKVVAKSAHRRVHSMEPIAPATIVPGPRAIADSSPTQPAGVAGRQIFAPDGSIRIQQSNAYKVPDTSLVDMSHRNVTHCVQTRFSRSAPRYESLGVHIARVYLVYVSLYNPYFDYRDGLLKESIDRSCPHGLRN